MGCPGFEPGTNRLKAEYSTVELATQELLFIAPFTTVSKHKIFVKTIFKKMSQLIAQLSDNWLLGRVESDLLLY
jgi:hypothetical protein